MKKRLFLLGLMSFMYVGARVLSPNTTIVKAVNEVLKTEKEITIVQPLDAPSNDDCTGAITLTVNADNSCAVTSFGTLASATDSGVDTQANGDADDDVWFSFVAAQTTQMLTLSNIQGEVTGLTQQVMDGDCDHLTLVASSDANILVASDLEVGHTYFVRVYSTYGLEADTTFNICVGLPIPGPVNDDCAGAIELTPNPDFNCGTITQGSIYFATNSGIPNPGDGSTDDDVWYKFVAASNVQRISISNIQGPQSGLVIQGFSGECGNFDNNNGVTGDFGYIVMQGLTIGNTYYVRIYNFGLNNYTPITFNICLGTPPPPPVNDDCDGATVLTVNPIGSCDAAVDGTVAGAIDSGVPNSDPANTGTADDDVWYSFVATSERHRLTLSDLNGSSQYGMVMKVLEGQCEGDMSEIASSQTNDLILNDLLVGTTYFVRIYSYTAEPAQTTTFKLCLSIAPPIPANDDCFTAIGLTVNPIGSCAIVQHGTIDQATDSNEPGNTGAGTADDDVWYSFVATTDVHTVSLSDVEGSNTYPVIEVLEGECGGGLTSIAYDQNNKFIHLTNLTVGNTYFVRIFSSGNSPETTSFDICVSVSPAVPSNDNCDNPIALTIDAGYCNGTNTNGDTTSASDSGFAVSPCSGYGKNDLWFTFTVPANVASVNISTDFAGGTLQQSQVAVYSGTCDQSTEATCSQHANEGNQAFIADFPVNVDETYMVRVSNYSEADSGSFCLEISTASTLSTGDFDKEILTAYPNPVKNILTLSNTQNITNVAVYNLLGQQVITKAFNANESQVDMSQLSAGTYMVKVSADNQVKTIKVIKE